MTEDWTPTHAHRKGGLYRFIGYGRNTEDGESVAIYEDILGNVWVRPRWMFDDGRFEPVVAVSMAKVPTGAKAYGIVKNGVIERVFVEANTVINPHLNHEVEVRTSPDFKMSIGRVSPDGIEIEDAQLHALHLDASFDEPAAEPRPASPSSPQGRTDS